MSGLKWRPMTWFRFAVVPLLLLGLPAISALGASFDCNKASTAIEKTICSDQELSLLDEKLGHEYLRAKQLDPSIIESQRSWLRERNRCVDAACLLHAYRDRISALGEISERKSQADSNVRQSTGVGGGVSQAEPEGGAISSQGSAPASESVADGGGQPDLDMSGVWLWTGVIGLIVAASAWPRRDGRFTTGYKGNRSPLNRWVLIGVALMLIGFFGLGMS